MSTTGQPAPEKQSMYQPALDGGVETRCRDVRHARACTTSKPRHPSASQACSRTVVARRRLGRALAFCLVVASTSVPAGSPDNGESTERLKQQREIALQTAKVIEEVRVAHIASRYRRPTEQVRRVVRIAERVAERHDLPAELLLAIMETESSFNPLARSSYGALGLMQVVPRFHPKIVKAVGGLHRLDEPVANIEAGAAILAAYVESSGSLRKALTRYSGGARNYATRIIERQREFEGIAIYATRNLDNVRVSEAREGGRRG